MKHAKTPWWRNRNRIAFGVFLAIAGYFLWREHEAHISPYLIWILLGACLLLHGFMHGGHGHNQGGDSDVGKPGDDGSRH